MEKIIVNPRQVRALGDIVSPKGVADFEKYCCTLTESTDASFGDLYTSEFLPGARLVIDYPGSVSVDDDDFTVDVLLKDDSGAVISGASVYCDFNGDLSSETTDSNGEASFTLSCDGESSEYWFRVCYVGTGSLAGAICRGVVTVVDYEGVDFSLMVDNPVLCGGEFAEFVAKLDVLNGSGVMVPVSGAVVEFYMDVDVEPASISLVSDKPILSYADGGDSCTLTATLTGSVTTGKTVQLFDASDDSLVGTMTDNSDGTYSYTYQSQGVGDINFYAKYSSFVSETYSIEDNIRYDDASSNKTSSYASPIVYRGSGSGAWNYNSSNGYYGTISENNEVMIPLTEITGHNDLTIEFDAKMTGSNQYKGIAGICAYEDNNNYSRLSCHGLRIVQRVSINGTATESESNLDNSVSTNDVLHFKFTISNNQIVEEVTRGTTSIGTRTISYTPTNNTKYGIALVWYNDWVSKTYLKNIKIKPL